MVDFSIDEVSAQVDVVKSKLDRIAAVVTELQAELAQTHVSPPASQEQINALAAKLAGIVAEEDVVAPPAPAPAPAPAPVEPVAPSA